MRIAISVWDGRISPVFDESRTLLLIDVDDSKVTSRLEVALTPNDAPARAARLVELGVQRLICGGISYQLLARIRQLGIGVTANVCGQVEEVIVAWLNGQIQQPCFAMPGCCRRRCQRTKQNRQP